MPAQDNLEDINAAFDQDTKASVRKPEAGQLIKDLTNKLGGWFALRNGGMRDGSMRRPDLDTCDRDDGLIDAALKIKFNVPRSWQRRSAAFSPTRRAEEYVFVPRLSYEKCFSVTGKLGRERGDRTGQMDRSATLRF